MVACLFITLILSSRSGFLLVFGRVVGKEGISCNIGSFFFLFFFFSCCHWVIRSVIGGGALALLLV